ncbi:MAG: hypothetical protein MJ007_01000 [Paludibacteraceae bacterium]|nr:hypothetical protein [Paludibacteraceae bacterium]
MRSLLYSQASGKRYVAGIWVLFYESMSYINAYTCTARNAMYAHEECCSAIRA